MILVLEFHPLQSSRRREINLMRIRKCSRLLGPRFPSAEITSASSLVAENTIPPEISQGKEGSVGVTDSLGDVRPISRNGSSSSAQVFLDLHATPPRGRVPLFRNPNGLFQIQDKFVAKCLSLLMDASGITSHPISCRYRTLSSIPAQVLISAARSIMDAFKEKNGLSSKYVKYSSLLPRKLGDEQVQFSSIALMRSELGYQVLNSGEKCYARREEARQK